MIAIFIRFENLEDQFSTIDDTGVAWTLTEHINDIDYQYVNKKIFDEKHEDYHSLQFVLLRKLNIVDYKNFIKFFIIPQSWTYAPLQFVLTQLLINESMSYKQIMFWGRFPSFLFSCISLFLFILICKKIYEDKWLYPSLTSVFIYSFSLENIIYSRHMSNYASASFSILIVLYIFLKILENKQLTIKSQLFFGLILALCVSLSYQAIFILPFLFIYLYVHFNNDGIKLNIFSYERVKNVLGLFVFFTFFSVLTYLPFLITQLNRGSSDMTQVPENFYFPIKIFHNSINLFNISYTVLNFIFTNFFQTIKFLFSFQSYYSFFSSIYISVIIIFICYSFFCFSKKKSYLLNHTVNILFLCFFSFIILVFFRLTPFSPTRHILFLLPIFILLFTMGIYNFYIKFLKKFAFKFKLIYFLGLVLIMVLFFEGFSKFNHQRKEIISYNLINQYIIKTNPQQIVIPNYFLINKLFPSNFIKDSVDITNGHTKYVNKNFSRNQIENILIIKVSDNYYNYNPNTLAFNYKLIFNDEFKSGSNLDITNDVKPSVNKILFEYYKLKL